ncbi:hypothetical protein [Protofrankia symbiont of Coriaria ruscifolia]|uniref:hypothetical protein n=1 Tax=Protofrankia symbiont of Coriaria ruscifolia TaxID=1306542 RepID=UPI001041687A|nr:hypothetical protein [Protofrankia symbiont of Coriaria ruscifolia]
MHVSQIGVSVVANAQGRRRPQTEQTASGGLKQFTQMSGWPSCARRAMRRTVPLTASTVAAITSAGSAGSAAATAAVTTRRRRAAGSRRDARGPVMTRSPDRGRR